MKISSTATRPRLNSFSSFFSVYILKYSRKWINATVEQWSDSKKRKRRRRKWKWRKIGGEMVWDGGRTTESGRKSIKFRALSLCRVFYGFISCVCLPCAFVLWIVILLYFVYFFFFLLLYSVWGRRHNIVKKRRKEFMTDIFFSLMLNARRLHYK